MRQKQPSKSVHQSLSESTEELRASCPSNIANEKSCLPQWVGTNYLASPSIKGKTLLPAQITAQKAQGTLVSGRQPLITVGEAADYLHVSQKTVLRMIKAGNLAIIRIGRSIRINPEVIEKIMRQDD
jgi:excisionase family DNA binding protein